MRTDYGNLIKTSEIISNICEDKADDALANDALAEVSKEAS